jgi:Glycosyl transferase family 2
MDPTTVRDAAEWAFTCLLPVWSGDKPDQFRTAIESVASSTLRPTETFVCQDGALPGDLEAAVGEYVDRFGARRLHNPGPRGLQYNLNHAMAQVTTPWTCRLDADDINLPARFENQIRFLRDHPEIAVLGGAIVEFWPDGRERRKVLPAEHEAIVRWARYRNPINHMTAFFRTAAFHDCGGYPDLPLKQDYGLWLRMIARGHRFANLETDLVRARLGPDFHARRAGFHNFASEYALFRLKRTVSGMGAASAAATMIARSAALAMTATTGVIYERILRR